MNCTTYSHVYYALSYFHWQTPKTRTRVLWIIRGQCHRREGRRQIGRRFIIDGNFTSPTTPPPPILREKVWRIRLLRRILRTGNIMPWYYAYCATWCIIKTDGLILITRSPGVPPSLPSRLNFSKYRTKVTVCRLPLLKRLIKPSGKSKINVPRYTIRDVFMIGRGGGSLSFPEDIPSAVCGNYPDRLRKPSNVLFC